MDTLTSLSDALAQAVERVARSIVTVHARRRVPSTGVHWRAGLVVTADHTVRADDAITITGPDGETIAARLAGRDAGTDLAVLSIDGGGIPAAEPVDAADLKVGHVVLALGYGPRASWGVVSALGGQWRTWDGGEIDRWISPDLVLYPGFSGGPLVDTHGRVIALNTSGLSRSAPVAIPASTVSRVSEELAATGRVARGYLGAGFQPVRLPEALRHTAGVTGDVGLIVVNLQPDGPAARAGVLLGDVLLNLDGTPVRDPGDVRARLGRGAVGRTVRASLVRAGALVEVPIAVGERPPSAR
jgi:S1-C subfamily serine protease